MDVRRFGTAYRSPAYTLARARETYETYYDIEYPGHERQAGRPLRLSSAYPWHAAHGASFGEKAGWERVNFYAANVGAAGGAEALRPRGWAGRLWSPAIVAEHRAARERAALFDESSFSKLEVTGPGAAALLARACANDVVRETGRVTYTQVLNARGGIEADVTVTRLGEERFLVVTGTAFGPRDLAWLRARARAEDLERHVRVDDVTAAWATFALWGPARPGRARAADPRRRVRRRLRLHAGAGRHRGRRPRPRAARDLRRRAGLGAVLPGRVRRRAVARAVGGRPGARPRGRRLPGHRHAAPGEGLPRVGRGHRARRHAAEAGLAWCVRRRRRLPRRRGAARPGAAHPAALPRPRRRALGRAGQRAGPPRRRRGGPGHEWGLRADGGPVRSPTPRSRPASTSERAWRSTCSAPGCRGP